MKNKNVIIALLCFLIVMAGAFVAWQNGEALSNTLKAVGLLETSPKTADAQPYMEKLRAEIPVLEVLPKKKKDEREVWKVGRGVSLPNYLLRAQKHLNRFGGKVLYMEEFASPGGTASASLDFTVPFGDTFQVKLQVADSFCDNTSRLAIGFYASSNLSKYIEDLNRLDYPYSMLITPAEKVSISADLDRLQGYAPVIWLPMEDRKLQPTSLSKSMIRIHLSDAEIQEIVLDAISQTPNAQGVASREGSRAVEQKALLRAVFAPLKERNLWFMDLSSNRYSKSLDVCETVGIECRIESPLDETRMTYDHYVSNVLKTAQRSGKAILLLPLAKGSFKAIEKLKDATFSQGTEIVPMSNIFKTE